MLLIASERKRVTNSSVSVDDKDDKQDIRILNELENIDDELEKEGIVIVRMDNDAEAKEYGIDHLPTLVYFENKIPAIYEGDLLNEDEVLEWLVEQKNTATIEEVTDEILTDLIEEHEYVVAYFSKYISSVRFHLLLRTLIPVLNFACQAEIATTGTIVTKYSKSWRTLTTS